MSHLQHQRRERFVFVLRVLFVAVIAMCLLGGRPPASAMMQASAKDAVQDERIEQVDSRIKNHESIDDARVMQLSRDLQIVANSVSEMRGEERGLFAALAVIQIIAILFQVRGRDKDSKR